MTVREQQQLLVEWNNTAVVYPRDKCVHQLFEEQVERTPTAVAVVFEGHSLTYRELNERANQLAHHLLRLGLEPSMLVGLCLERSLELVVGILGIMKAGCAYVPLDANYPYQRLEFMLDDAKIGFLVTQSGLLARLPTHNCRVVCLDTEVVTLRGQDRSNPPSRVGSEHLAYVMYTSGSTGQPKGVMIRHNSIARLVFGNNYATFGPDQVFLQLAPISFDASTFELWGALLHGATLVIAPPGHLDFHALEDLLQRHQVTTLWLTAALFNQVIEQYPQALRGVRELLTGGEALSVRHIRLAQEALGSGVQLINGYGPTECTTFAVCYRIPSPVVEAESIPIGKPIGNTQVYVLDEKGQVVPAGVPGELYLGGAGLARGYLNRPELTAERFVPDPFSTDSTSRLYRTGDKCRWRADGHLEFLGRLDNQIKLRGYRIELAEIEAVMNQYPSVTQSVAVLREDHSGDKRLVAYYTQDAAVDVASLTGHLRARLPEYMVPSAFVRLDELPLTANGKLDRGALPAPEHISQHRTSEYVAPRNPVEEQLAILWREVLRIEHVGIHDNFFDLGGHSLLAVQLFCRIEKLFGRKLPLAVLFQQGTISHLSTLLTDTPHESEIAKVMLLQPGGDGRTLFLMPTIAGELIFSKSLIEELGRRFPIKGIQPTLASEHIEHFRDIRATARHFVKALLAHQPHGPYALAGFSYGGMLAFEVASLLAEWGEKVDLLVVIDTGPGYRPLHPRFRDRWKRVTDIVGNLPNWVREEFRQLSVGDLLNRSGRKLRRILRFLTSGGRATVKLDDIFDMARIPSQNRELLQTFVDAVNTYTPDYYSGRLTLFRSRARKLFGDCSRDLGWGQYAESVDVRSIDGNHETLLRPPHIGELTRQLAELLETRP